MSQSWNTALLDMRLHVEELMEELVYRRWSIDRPTTWRPLMDFHEAPEAYRVEIDLPGVAPEQVRLVVGERSLTITGQRQTTVPELAFINRCERPSGSFRRCLEFSSAIDPERVSTEYRHGTCLVVLPKRPPGEQKARNSSGMTAEALRVVPLVALRKVPVSHEKGNEATQSEPCNPFDG